MRLCRPCCLYLRRHAERSQVSRPAAMGSQRDLLWAEPEHLLIRPSLCQPMQPYWAQSADNRKQDQGHGLEDTGSSSIHAIGGMQLSAACRRCPWYIHAACTAHMQCERMQESWQMLVLSPGSGALTCPAAGTGILPPELRSACAGWEQLCCETEDL